MVLTALRKQQQQLAGQVMREDALIQDPPQLIGGADVGFEQGGEITRAAIILLKFPSIERVEYPVARPAFRRWQAIQP